MTSLLVSKSQATPVLAPARHKRVLDIGLIVLALPVLLPVLVILILAVRLSSSGPVLFFQTRVGRDGKRFRLVKFRSMYADAETRRAALLDQSDRSGVCFKHKADPRITPVGRFLRRSSLDELPQLWNVLKGEMSLVGPRPALPEEVAVYTPDAMLRLAGLPGLTGLWQVSGRADIGFDEMVAMDVAYLQTASLRGDLALIARTFGAVALARGAY
ncbi:MAG: sugar transferase [Pseudotabrizicola sp.]|uniref:sugar transferase n=1 Tax=Pseudotabrizicola sp. TaxID=2939647 RepID=UPI002716D0B8|nr:sugar transferase [Pseudotabrizicola sp.]MDO9637725.1 sugar transferase [Pseudotabrizicola sp.]